MRKPLKNFPYLIGLVHWGLGTCVTGSLISSIFINTDKPPTALPVTIHLWFGTGVGSFILLQWLLLLLESSRQTKEHLFPYNKEGKERILRDLKLLFKKKLPPTGLQSGLSGLVEGLGLFLITGMAFLGLILYLGILFNVLQTLGMSLVLDFHSFFSGFVWAFVIGHGGMAVIHKIQQRV